MTLDRNGFDPAHRTMLGDGATSSRTALLWSFVGTGRTVPARLEVTAGALAHARTLGWSAESLERLRVACRQLTGTVAIARYIAAIDIGTRWVFIRRLGVT